MLTAAAVIAALAGMAAYQWLRDDKQKAQPPEAGSLANNGNNPNPAPNSVEPKKADPADPKPANVQALKGFIDVKVWRDGHTDEPAMRLNHPDALPLVPGDWLRIEVELNRLAYIYIVWIDTEGKATPFYPWIEGDWKKRPKIEKRITKTSLPESAKGIAPLDPGPAGIETLLLLARDEPLPADVDLAQLFAGLPKQKAADPRVAAWFENGDLVFAEKERGPIRLDKAKESDDPVLKTQALLKTRLQMLFPYTRGVSFANKGD